MPPVKRDDGRPDVPLSAITRREFLALGGAATLAAFPGCKPQFHPGGEHPDGIRPPGGPESFGRAICGMCASGCGVIVRAVGGRAVGISGNREHPVNGGALCPRGAAGLQHLYDLDRVVGPARRKGEKLERVPWDDALAELATRVAGGGVVLVEALRGVEADLAARFARATGAMHLRADPLRQAHEGVVGRQAWNWTQTRLAVFFGCEFAEDAPDLMASLRAYAHRRQGTGGRTVHVGPRFSTSAGHADEFVAVKPGTEGALALGMAHVLLGEEKRSANPPESYRRLVERFTPEETANVTGVKPATVIRLAREFGAVAPQLAIGWRGLLDQTNGADALAAVHALNHLVGSAAQMSPPVRPPLLNWGAPIAAGAPPGAHHAAPRVLITAGGNPVYTAPELLEPFAAAEFRVAIGPLLDETALAADLVLPTPTWLERFEVDVPPSAVQSVAVARPAIAPLHDTRVAGDILLAVAHRLPALRAAFSWDSYDEAARERLFGLFLAQTGSVREEKWENFLERLEATGVWTDADAPRAAAQEPRWPERWDPPSFTGEGPVLVTFASLALGEGEGASLPWLQEIAGWQHHVGWDSWIEVHPRHGFSTGERVLVRSPRGEVRARVVATPTCPPDVVAMPLGQGHSASGRWALCGADARRLGSGVRVTLVRS